MIHPAQKPFQNMFIKERLHPERRIDYQATLLSPIDSTSLARLYTPYSQSGYIASHTIGIANASRISASRHSTRPPITDGIDKALTR